MSVHPDKTAFRAVDACSGTYTPDQLANGWADGHRAALSDATTAVARVDELMGSLLKALEPFANLGVTSGPDDEPCHFAYRITRGSIRAARAACDQASGAAQ